MFDGIIQINEKGEIVLNQWIEWDHFLVPNKPEWLREIIRNILAMAKHCLSCTAIDGCYLVKRNMPKQPLHKNCDCKKKRLTYTKVKKDATAECDIRKFTHYIFNKDGSKGKDKIFYDLGFSIDDSEYLKQEYCQQALQKYLNGDYELKELDKFGLRISISIRLNDVDLLSGWLLKPNGKIRNITPFGGWLK